MVDMALTKKEAEDEFKIEEDTGPRYPWGLNLTLHTESLEKLAMDLPSVGDELSLVAVVKVTSVSERERQGNDKNQDVELQITEMELDGGSSRQEKAAGMFPTAES